MPTILTSPKLTALLEDRDKLKARAEQSRAEVWRKTQIVSPQFQDATVRTVTDERDEAARKKAVVSTGIINEQDEAARKEDALKRTLAGEPLADSIGVKEQLEREHRQFVRVVRLTIERFRGVKSATLDFTGHTLFVGANNVGKSTVLLRTRLSRRESAKMGDG
jgi:ribosome biogenesis GTPase A